jgi:hypothetical protein
MALNIAERTIRLTAVRPGMLLKIQYTTGVYMVFVVNENRMNVKTNKFQLHAYKLNQTTTETDLINILVNLNAGIIVDSVNKEIRTQEITDTVAYEARYILRGVDARPYRTFNIENIREATRLSIELPEIIDRIIRGEVIITSKDSKRQLLTCAQSGDEECIKEIPEIRSRMITKKRTPEEIAKEEARERENMLRGERENMLRTALKIIVRPARNAFNTIRQYIKGEI